MPLTLHVPFKGLCVHFHEKTVCHFQGCSVPKVHDKSDVFNSVW